MTRAPARHGPDASDQERRSELQVSELVQQLTLGTHWHLHHGVASPVISCLQSPDMQRCNASDYSAHSSQQWYSGAFDVP